MTRKIFSVFCFAVALFVSCGKETGTDEKEGSAILLCMTSEASGVTQTSAILNGTATIKNAKASKANAYFYYSTTQADAKTLKASGQRLSAGSLPNTGGDFSANLSSLSPATSYYYVASVSIDDKEELGGVKAFTTEKKTDSFSVTGTAFDITVNSATLTAYANLPADMTGDVTIGIIYSTNSSPTLQNGKLLTSRDLDVNNMYQVEVTDLTPATKYYFKSFLSRSNLNYYGEVKDFTTAQVLASVSTLDAWDVAETKASVGGKVEVSSAGNIRKEASIYYGADCSNIDALKTKGKRIGVEAISEDGMFTTSISGLTSSTKYNYAAVVLVEGIEFAGAIKSFTISDKPTEIAITGEAADIGDKSATLYGWSNQEGSAGASVVFGMEYSATDLTTAATTVSASEKDAENRYSCRITGLMYNTIYYYRAFTFYNGVRTYGEVKTFKTLYFPVSSVSLDLTTITIYRGASDATKSLIATIIPSYASNTAVTWTSSNTSVATVSSSGVVTGRSRGNATITVTANDGDGAQATCEIEVKQYVTSISLNKTSLSQEIGDEVTLSVTILPDNANVKTYTWSSSDSAIASVDNSGKVTAKAKGKATIKATANDGSGVNATCSVVVSPKCPAGAVDMGTTTADGYKLYWSTRNLCESGFVNSPEEYGDYYAWGETAPYYSSQSPLTWKNGKSAGYNWASYKWCNGSYGTLTKYNTKSYYGTVDNKTVLEPEDDVASVKLGGKWHMPTYAEWEELKTKCTWTWTTNYNGTGVAGRIVSATNGNSIFLPAAGYWSGTGLYRAGPYGYYWSSFLDTEFTSYAWGVDFDSDYVGRNGGYNRFLGRSVRPVSE